MRDRERAGGRRVGHHRLGLDQHAARRGRHFHAVAMAIEQLGAQTALERLDAATDGRLLGVQLRSSSTETSGFGDGQEKSDVVPIAENIRHFAFTGCRRDHGNNRYNRVWAEAFTWRVPRGLSYTIDCVMSFFVSFIGD